MPLTTPNGLRAETDIEGMREWRRKKRRPNRELASEMMPSSWMLAGGLRSTQMHVLLGMGLVLSLTGPGHAATATADFSLAQR